MKPEPQPLIRLPDKYDERFFAFAAKCFSFEKAVKTIYSNARNFI